MQTHENATVRITGQCEARHRKCEAKFGCGQAYDRSSDWAAVVAEAT
jgi:hypothetical protein